MNASAIYDSKAKQGGALFTTSYDTVHVNFSTVANSYASFGGGFALSNVDKELFDFAPRLQAFRTAFYNVTASVSGGLLFSLEDIPSSFVSNVASNYSTSSAGYGAVASGAPTYVMLKKFTTTTTNFSTSDEGAKLQVFPGEQFELSVVLLDFMNQTVTQYPDFTVRLSIISDKPSSLFASALELPITSDFGGVVTYSNVQIFTQQVNSVTLRVSAPNVRKNLTMTVDVKNCPPGYVFDATGSEKLQRCVICQKGLFSLSYNSSQCRDCPINAECSGNSITVAKGYWLYTPSNVTEYPELQSEIRVIACPNSACDGANRCTGSRDPTSPFCAACLKGLSEWNGSCMECESSTNAFLVVFILYIVGIFVFQHFASQTGSSGVGKILFFFGQTWLLLVGSSSTLFVWARVIFSFELVGSSGALKLCPFYRDSQGKLITNLTQSFAFFILLFIASALAFVCYQIYSCVIKRKKERALQKGTTQSIMNIGKAIASRQRSKTVAAVKDKLSKILTNMVFSKQGYVISFVNLILITYQTFTVAGLDYFKCKLVGDKRYLIHSSDIVCFSDWYYQWYVVTLAFLFILGLLPTLLR